MVVNLKTISQEKEVMSQQLLQAQKLESIGQLAGGIAHDFNNILCSILGHNEIIRRGIDASNTKALKSSAIITQAVKRGSDLTTQLVGFARQGQYQRTVFDLKAIIGESLNLLTSISTSEEYTFYCPHESVLIEGDPSQWSQVILNLALNAKAAMPQGGKIAIYLNKVDTIHIKSALIKGTYAELLIEDEGSGIPANIREKIFEPYFTTKGPGEGSGLGLSMVLGIVKNHQGYIEVVERRDKQAGTGFQIYLPTPLGPSIYEADLPAANNHTITEWLAGKKVLVVEDEEALREYIGDLLESFDCHILYAANGQEAIDAFATHNDIDLMTLDLIMPKVNGIIAYYEIVKRHPDLPIIIASGHSDDSEVAKIINTNQRVTFIRKPFNEQELLQAVEKVV